jgi:fermentation-respiration switch protein FrsA (DUF1100 family)
MLDFSDEPGGPAEVVSSETLRGCVRETWRFDGSEGDEVLADAYLSPEPGPVVIGGHGRDDGRGAQYLRGPGLQWAPRGISLVAADAPLHGDRAGERPVPRVTITDIDLLARWVKDHKRLVDAVRTRFGEGVPIGFMGMSMGAVMGCHLLAEDERLAAGILVVGGSTGVSVPERFGGDTPPEALLTLTDPVAPAPRIAPRPVLMINADEDEVFSRRSALALYDALLPPKEISFFPGRHAEWHSPAQWSRRMWAFLERVLPGPNRS